VQPATSRKRRRVWIIAAGGARRVAHNAAWGRLVVQRQSPHAPHAFPAETASDASNQQAVRSMGSVLPRVVCI